MKKKLLLIMVVCMMVFGMVGCGTSGDSEGEDATVIEESKSDDSDSKTAENDTETAENDLKTENNVAVDEESVAKTGNPLLDTELVVADVMNGAGTKAIGESAFVVVDLETMKNVTEEQYHEFCEGVVRDSGYNWITIDFNNGTGLCFQGSSPALATYGKIDNEKCITEQMGNVMSMGDGTYEFTAFE